MFSLCAVTLNLAEMRKIAIHTAFVGFVSFGSKMKSPSWKTDRQIRPAADMVSVCTCWLILFEGMITGTALLELS